MKANDEQDEFDEREQKYFKSCWTNLTEDRQKKHDEHVEDRSTSMNCRCPNWQVRYFVYICFNSIYVWITLSLSQQCRFVF